METEEIHGEPSIRLSTPEVTLHLTPRGGHLAPVTFHLPEKDVSPYALAPWEPREFPDHPPLLSVLRGDFFCLPFGPQQAGPPHGDPANAKWTLEEKGPERLRMRMIATDSGARIGKTISLRPGEHAVYADHQISGLSGDFSYGNHPVLDLSGLPEGAGRVTTSATHWASVYPGLFSDPANGESQALLPAAEFHDLREVPLASGGTTDLTRYPFRAGNDDLVMLVNAPATDEQSFAWSAVTFDGYVWFSLKNPRDFPATLLWMSNGGRGGPPWLGRHFGRIGVEEVCSHFADGVDVSRQNPLGHLGIPTSRSFQAGETVSLRTIQAVAPIPPGFGEVSRIVPRGREAVSLIGGNGGSLVTLVDWGFVL